MKILDRIVWRSSYSRLGFQVIKVNNKGFADSQGLTNPTDTPEQVEGFPLLTVSTRQIQEVIKFVGLLNDKAAVSDGYVFGVRDWKQLVLAVYISAAHGDLWFIYGLVFRSSVEDGDSY
ncbi:hypothetical protein Tco_1561731 [Tanacetum coccineum]